MACERRDARLPERRGAAEPAHQHQVGPGAVDMDGKLGAIGKLKA